MSFRHSLLRHNDNPSEHQLCDDTLESLGNINLSVLPRKRRTVCCWEPSREVSAWVSLVNSALEPQSSRALVPFPVIRVDRFTIFQTQNYIIIPQPETGMPLACLEKSSLVCFSDHLTHLFMKILHRSAKAFSTRKKYRFQNLGTLNFQWSSDLGDWVRYFICSISIFHSIIGAARLLGELSWASSGQMRNNN